MLAHSFLIKSSSKLLVTRTGIKARMSLISGLWFPWPIYMFFEMRFDLGTLDSGERSLPFGLLVFFAVKHFQEHNKIGPCRTFVAKYIINENANFDLSIPVLVGEGEAIYPTVMVLKSEFVIWRQFSFWKLRPFAEFLRRSEQHTLWGNVTEYFFKSGGMHMR